MLPEPRPLGDVRRSVVTPFRMETAMLNTTTRLAAILAIGQQQANAFTAFARAEAAKSGGDYRAARPVYEHYVAEARTFLEATLAFNREFPDSPYDVPPVAQPLVNALMVCADIVDGVGARDAAGRMRQEALDVARTHLGRDATADTERARAASLIGEGHFNEAIVALLGARDVAIGTGDPVAVARVTIDLADVLQWLGDYSRAKEEIEHAEHIIAGEVRGRQANQQFVVEGMLASLAAITAGGRDPGHALRAANLYRGAVEVVYYHGLISKALGEWDEAERCFTEVLPEYRRLGVAEAIEFQLAHVELKRANHRAALERLERIAPAFERGAYRPKRGVLLRLQAECLVALGHPAQARTLVDRSLEDLAGRYYDPNLLWSAQWLRGQIVARSQGAAAALPSYHEALGTIAELRRAPLGYRLDSTFLADKKTVYSEAVASAAQAGAADEACAFAESLKSRTLAAIMSVPQAAAQRPRTDGGVAANGLASTLETLTRDLDAREYQAYRDGWTRELKSAHRKVLQDRATLLERIRISDPRWHLLTQPASIDLRHVLEQLAGRRQMALTLFYDPPRIVAVLLGNGRAVVDTLELTAPTLKAIGEYGRALERAHVDPFQYDFSVAHGVRVSDLIPQPLVESALSGDSLVVIPHDQLHVLPWAGLLHEQRRLFELVPVGVLPSLAAMGSAGHTGRPTRVMRVGVGIYPGLDRLIDLPSVTGEIEDVGRAYSVAGTDVPDALLGDTATERGFWQAARRLAGPGSLLHMSCHGTMVPTEPMSSGLLLTDAKIDAAEIAQGGARFDEVVLSACSTGWRPHEVDDVRLTADEILGIPGGFLEAGTAAVLVSIPPAEGRAARALTTRYHEARAEGTSPLHAFQRAQRHMLASGTLPGTWVGFTLYGAI